MTRISWGNTSVRKRSARPDSQERACFATFRERPHSSFSRTARTRSVHRLLMPSMHFVATLLISFLDTHDAFTRRTKREVGERACRTVCAQANGRAERVEQSSAVL